MREYWGSCLENEELENRLMALAIKAFGSKPAKRSELCFRALDAIEVLTN